MNRTILNLSMLVIAYVGLYTSLQAQNSINNFVEIMDVTDDVIFEQPIVGRYGSTSNYSTLEESGIYMADDFKVDSNMEATWITVYGLQPRGNLLSVLEGFDLLIYADDSGKPNGDPSQIGSGILEIRNLNPNNTALTIIPDGDEYFNFSVDISAANGGNALELVAEKTYWICAYTRLSVAPAYSFDESWRWRFGTPSSDPLSAPHMIDPDNRYGEGTDWSPISIAALAFKIEGSSLNVNDNLINKISVFPNPSKEALNISIDSSLSVNYIDMYDILGKKMNVVYKNGVLDLASLARGIYILMIDTDSGKLTRKIIKE